MWKKYAEKSRSRNRGRHRKTYHDDIESYLEDPAAEEDPYETDPDRPKTAAEVCRELSAQGGSHKTYTIGGVKIKFPASPYPSQYSMMDRIIKGLDRSQNCLLESPTGSGKSLALLCSALAWQQAQREKIKKEMENKQNDCCCRCHRPREDVPAASNKPSEDVSKTTQDETVVLEGTTVFDETTMDEDDDDFKMPKTNIKNVTPARPHIVIEYDHGQPAPSDSDPHSVPMPDMYRLGPDSPCHCQCNQQMKIKVPKIYFGTRTHKQIAQITRELAKTEYRDVKMTILASREHTCIDPYVSSKPKKTEECKNKREGPGCYFFDNVRKVTYSNMAVNGLDMAWDLEDFVIWSKKHKSCPYYGSRQLRDMADIIFCPYNYLIDPLIRSSMEIEVKGEIIILDEAHNIEDSARESASFSMTRPEIEDSLNDLRKMSQQFKTHKKYVHWVAMSGMLARVDGIIDKFKDTLGADNYDQANRIWSGVDIVAQLKEFQLGPEDIQPLLKSYHFVCEEDPDDKLPVQLPAACTSLFEGLFLVLDCIYRQEMKYMNDYRVALVRTMVYTQKRSSDEWMGKGRRSFQREFLFTLNFWCMNPAVAFSEFHDVKSVILTSGTLSPMTSFQSELGQPFPIQLEANHVIKNSQVWVGSVSKGPRGANLLGSYQHTETFQYQDELGHLVLEVCKTVPHGVLCFLTSYKMIEKLVNRWQTTGLYDEICKCKEFFREPRGADKDKVNFDDLLKNFYSVIKSTGNADPSSGGLTGALFLAVCRGKVSEGMDFADNNARAVITVGIPFPNVMDTQIGLKRKYNNEHSGTRGLLSGSEWYEIQAYRALNQALGRCIRHRYDWGALILVDERFCKNPNKYTKGLSKWVRQKVNFFGYFPQAKRSLKEFTEHMLASPPGSAADSTSASQMDTSVAVEISSQGGAKPTAILSPPPPVLPPASPASSPPLDTSNLSLQPTPSLNPNTTGTAPYALDSQAGGFFASQTMVSIVKTLVKPGGHNPTQSSQFSIVAGPGSTQKMDLNETLDFKPPMASTQAPGRIQAGSQLIGTLPNGRLSFEPGSSSTQVASFDALDRIKSDFQTQKPSASTPKSKIQKSKAKKDDDPMWEPPSGKNRIKNEKDGKTSQVIDLTEDDAEAIKDFLIDERSNSPLLFDSEEQSESQPSVLPSSDMKNIKNENVQNFETKANHEDTLHNQRPLFDPEMNQNDPNTMGGNNEYQKVPESKTPRRGRLSRRKSTDKCNNLVFSDNSDATLPDIPKNIPDEKRAVPGRKVRRGVVYDDSEGEEAAGGGQKSEKGEEVVEGAGGDFGAEEINKKRTNKRRRVSSTETPNTLGVDILNATGNLKLTQVCCKCCQTNLMSSPQGFSEEDLPAYIKDVLPSSYSSNNGKVLTGDASYLAQDRCKPLSASSRSGLLLNSIWCEDEGCCLRFYSCSSNKCKSKSNIAVVIEMYVKGLLEHMPKNKIWCLPTQCLPSST